MLLSPYATEVQIKSTSLILSSHQLYIYFAMSYTFLLQKHTAKVDTLRFPKETLLFKYIRKVLLYVSRSSELRPK